MDVAPNSLAFAILFICNTFMLIGSIMLLVSMGKAEIKDRKEKKKVDDK